MYPVTEAVRAPVTLPLHCTACLNPVRVIFRPDHGHEKFSLYTCPYCVKEVRILLSGDVLSVHRADDRR